MLKELTRSDWLRILNIPETRIPVALILRGTRNLKAQYQAILPYFENVLEVGSPNGIFEDVLIGKHRGRSVAFACVYGANMASEITHVFVVLGTRAVIQTDNCGALADGFQAGVLFVADKAFAGEGAAQYYKPGNPWIDASPELLKRLKAEPCVHGAIYTTAALLAESMDDVERWHQQGFAAVDMETATTYAVAEHYGMARLSILYAFDNPRQREHILLSDAQKDERLAKGNTRMRELAFELAADCG